MSAHGAGVEDPKRRFFEASERLGVFTVSQLVSVTGSAAAEAEQFLRSSPEHFEWLKGRADRADRWRLREDAQAPATPRAPEAAPTQDPGRPLELAKQADAALKALERGFVQDPGGRETALKLAEHRIGLAVSMLDQGGSAEAALRRRLGRGRRRARALLETRDAAGGDVVSRLGDWTDRMTPASVPPGRGEAFDLQTALASAVARAAVPHAASGPALALVAAGLPDAAQARALTAELDHLIRGQALAGDPFKVLTLSLVAAVTGAAGLADALASAITTPAFRAAADRGTMRATYTALANLARPGCEDAQAASAACVYLMQRARPGPDEMELLAPAAMQTIGADSETAIKLLARWLLWETERCMRDPKLHHLSHAIRNFACSLHVTGFEPLDRGLHAIANDESGVVLVQCLADEEHDALLLHLMHPEPPRDAPQDDILAQPAAEGAAGTARCFGAQPRARVADVTDPTRERSLPAYFTLPPDCTVAEAIARMQVVRKRRRPGAFTGGLPGGGDGHA